MAITPPDNNFGDFNTNPTGPVVWDDVARTNNEVIDRSDMPFASTAEFKGYYKAESTGKHTFRLAGSNGVTGYSWLSSAPKTSDHIPEGGNQKVEVALNKSYGIIIPNKRGTGTWPFEDTNVLGTSFIGYGYWPKTGYGNESGWLGKYGSGRQDAPSTACGYSIGTAQYHQYMLPGDIRTYESAPITQYGGRNAGPGWQGPEDPNFASPCYPSSQSTPLKRICRSSDSRPCDSDATPNTVGKSSQVFLDTSFKAEGVSTDSWATYEIVQDDRVGDMDGGHVYIWPQAVNVFTSKSTSKSQPERVNVRFALRMRNQPAQKYTFEWKSRDGLKMWYKIGGGDSREFEKFPDTSGGHNPCNKTATGTWTSETWLPGRGEDGFTGQVDLSANGYIQFIGHAAGVPGSSTHGWSLVVRDAQGLVVWDTSYLVVSEETGLVGIDECGYNALLSSDQRIPANRTTEMYKLDGWKGYSTNDVFVADAQEGDTTPRSYDTTRQYLWSNAIAKCRGGTDVTGTVFLRQGDYYFIRTIVSNDLNQAANYRFTVTSPGGGSAKTVKFTGNGDPGSDSTVGGNSGGNGIPINPSQLCNSVLAPGGSAVQNNDVNFALVQSLGVVINLSVGPLLVRDFEIGREGQAEIINGTTNNATASKILNFPSPENGGNPVPITITQLVQGQLDQDETAAVLDYYDDQVDAGTVLPWNTFRSAITSQAVIQWGRSGNYPFIYHAVSDVINSICNGTEIDVPTRPNTTNTAGGNDTNSSTSGTSTGSGTSECLDINISVLSSGQAQVTSECLDECRTPNQFPMLESQYTEPAGYYDTVPDPIYEFYVKIEKDYGMVSPTSWSAPGPSQKGDYDISIAYAQKNSVKFEPEYVTTVPLTIPDVFVPDNFDIVSSGNGALECTFWFELSSNTFLYDPNNKGDAIEGGIFRPYLVWWVSKGPGGVPLGDYYFTRPSYSTTPRMYATMNPEQWIYYNDQTNNPFKGYLGNTNGVRWLNFAPLQYQGVQDLNFNIPLPGTTGFLDLLSVKGYTSNEIRIKGTATSPDCSLQKSKLLSNDNSFKSASDMMPFIGE